MRLVEGIRQDVSYAARGLRRSPGLTAAVLVTFALGIGVNAAMFTVVDRVFFQAPPGVVDPGAVRRLFNFGVRMSDVQFASALFTTREVARFREVAGKDAEIEGYDAVDDQTIGRDSTHRTVAYATSGFFHLAGVVPYRGRFFTSDENQIGDPHPVAVLSHALWQSAFSGDSSLLGRAIRIDGALFTVIGIAPPRFEGMNVDVVDVWVPLATLPSGLEGSALNGDFEILQLFARMVPGADAPALYARLNTEFRRNRSFALSRDSTISLQVAPLLQARSALGVGFNQAQNVALVGRLGAVGIIVLIVAVTNVASLLLMRALRRRREIAIRVALGISRRRLAGQLVVESLLLALVGGVIALWIARLAGGLLRTLLLANVHWTATVIDGRLVTFTMLAAVVTGALAGLAPATVAMRRDILRALKTGGAESGRARSWTRNALLVAQTALCMLLLAAAGVFIQSLRSAQTSISASTWIA